MKDASGPSDPVSGPVSDAAMDRAGNTDAPRPRTDTAGTEGSSTGNTEDPVGNVTGTGPAEDVRGLKEQGNAGKADDRTDSGAGPAETPDMADRAQPDGRGQRDLKDQEDLRGQGNRVNKGKPGEDRNLKGTDGVTGVKDQRDAGDRIIFGSLGEASNLIPYLSSDSASHEVADLLYVSPLRYNKDLEVECYAAESYTVEDDGRRLRFRLRPHILWEDGEEVTAYDMEYTWKVVTDPGTASPYAEDFLRVKEFHVLDRYTFEVIYDTFYVRAISSWMSAILPKHVLEGQDIRHTEFSRKPVGAGPYRLKEWKTGSSIVLEASPSYFLGKPRLEQVVFRIIPDQATMFMETRAGRLDVTDLSPLQYLRETDGPVWSEQYRKYRYLASMYVFMGFNLEHPFFSDVRVRQAISMAISREEIVQGCLLGQGIPAFGPYKPGSWAYHPALKPVERDQKKAAALLAEAGFADHDNDGILDRDGHPFRFTILTNQGNEQRILVALLIQDQLRRIGIDVKIRTVEWAAFIREFVNKGQFDSVILGWTVSQDPDIYQVWHSSQAHDGGLNFVHYRNPVADRLLEEARSTPDQARRRELYLQFQEELYRDTPYCFLFVPYALPLVHRRFHGIEPALAGIMYNFEEWWVPKKEQKYQVVP